MGLLSWLFGKPRDGKSSWHESESGNQTRVTRGMQVTVYRKDGGWRFACGEVGAETEDVHFSETYYTEEEAREEAMRFVNGEPSVYRNRSEIVAERNITDDKLRVSAIHREWNEKQKVISDLKAMRKADLQKNLRHIEMDYRTLFLYGQDADMPMLSKAIVDEMEPVMSALRAEIRSRPDRKRKSADPV